jgi:hypothetical protein
VLCGSSGTVAYSPFVMARSGVLGGG